MIDKLRSSRRRRSPTWPVLAAALAGVLLLTAIGGGNEFSMLKSATGAVVLGEIVGFSVPIAAIAWAAAYFGWLRTHGPDKAAPYLIILVVVALAANGTIGLVARDVADHQSDQQSREATADLRSALENLGRRGVSATIDTTPRGGGDAAISEGLLKQEWASLLANQKTYLAEVHALGIPDALRPERLAHENLAATAANIVKAKDVEARHRSIEDGLIADFRAKVVSSSMSGDHKRQVLASLDNGAADDKSRRDQRWLLDASFLDEARGAVLVMQRSRGEWIYARGKLLFFDRRTLQAYDTYVVAMQSDAASARALRAQNLQLAEDSLGDVLGSQ